jgi:hypothetical protein
MATIYVLQGPGNCGKTSTIKELFNQLHAKYPNSAIRNYFPKSYDIKIEMQNINGHHIGIESQGDPNSRLYQSLNDFDQIGCDIIFCAARTKGMTVQWVNAHSPKYQIAFIPQTRVRNPHQQPQRNQNVAQNIIIQAGL